MPRRISTSAKRTLGQESFTSTPEKASKMMKLTSASSDGSESNCSSPDVVDRPSTSMMAHHQYSESKATTTHPSEVIQHFDIYPQQSIPPKPISVAGVASTSIAHQVDQFSASTPIAETSTINTTMSSTKRRFNKAKSSSDSNNTNSSQSTTQSPPSPETLTLRSSANIKATVLTENASPSKIIDPTTMPSDPSPIMIATSQSLTNTASSSSSNNNTEIENLNDSLNTSTTINTDNIQDFDFIVTDPDVKMQFKKSRDYNFIPSFPKVLYTLTWKHKYDLKISSEKPIFQGVPQKLMMSQIKIELVMGRDFSTPSYDHSKVRQRDRTVSEESRKKRPHRKPNESETTTLTSVSKDNDHSIVVRFGINRTFCSKRFNYAPFRLRLDFESDKHPFTLFTPIFHTFAKKLTGFTVVNVNEILKKNGEALLPVENTDEVCTDLVGVYRPSIPVDGYQSEQGESVASSSRTGAPSKDSADPEATNEDANLLLSLGGLL